MRLLLIFSLFFTSAIDACYAEEFVESIAQALGIENLEPCTELESNHKCDLDFHASNDSEGQHESHNSCHNCHNCHVWVSLPSQFINSGTELENLNTAYKVSVSYMYDGELFRPPIQKL